MKKLLSCIMIIVILVSAFVFSADAVDVSEDLYEQMFDYFGGNEIEDFTELGLPDDVPKIVIGDYAEKDGIEIFCAFAIWRGADLAEITECYGDWCVHAFGITYPSHTAMFCRINGKIYTLREAWDSGLVTDLSPAVGFSRYTCVYAVGDADLDYQVSVMDATLIQMRLASLAQIRFFEVADFDKDKELSVMDSTAIQMKLAQL